VIEPVDDEFLDLGIGSRLLAAKVVGRKARHHKSLLPVFHRKPPQVDILMGKTALTGNILDQQGLPRVSGLIQNSVSTYGFSSIFVRILYRNCYR